MRGCLTLIVGFVLGSALMLYWWPRTPAGSAIPQSSDVRVFISDSYLSRKAQQKANSLTLVEAQHVRVTSAPPSSLVVHADVGAVGLLAPAALELRPRTVSGGLDFQVATGNVAGVPMPGVVTSLLQDTINSTVHERAGNAAHVKAIRVTGGGLEIFADYQ